MGESPASWRGLCETARSDEHAAKVFLKLWRSQQAQSENRAGSLYRVAVCAGLDELLRQRRRGRQERALAWARPRPPAGTPEDIHSVSQEKDKVRSLLVSVKPSRPRKL
jgi:hypothetical protein